MTYASVHGKKRLKERVGIKPRSADRMARKIFAEGTHHRDLSGNLLRWVNDQCDVYHNRPVIYKDKCYMFGGEKLITVLNIPKGFLSKTKKGEKR